MSSVRLSLGATGTQEAGGLPRGKTARAVWRRTALGSLADAANNLAQAPFRGLRQKGRSSLYIPLVCLPGQLQSS